MRRKSDPEKVAIAMRLRRETTLTTKYIAFRLSFPAHGQTAETAVTDDDTVPITSRDAGHQDVAALANLILGGGGTDGAEHEKP